MKNTLDQLYSLLKSPSKVAHFLQYSDRHLRNIRRKVDRGEPLDPRVELWIKTRRDLLESGVAATAAGK